MKNHSKNKVYSLAELGSGVLPMYKSFYNHKQGPHLQNEVNNKPVFQSFYEVKQDRRCLKSVGPKGRCYYLGGLWDCLGIDAESKSSL